MGEATPRPEEPTDIQAAIMSAEGVVNPQDLQEESDHTARKSWGSEDETSDTERSFDETSVLGSPVPQATDGAADEEAEVQLLYEEQDEVMDTE